MILHMLDDLNVGQIISATLALFAVIDPLGSIPLYIKYRKKLGDFNVLKVTLLVIVCILIFLFISPYILQVFKITIKDFAVAGALIMLILGLEMILNIELAKEGNIGIQHASLMSMVIPVILGPATLTTLLTLQVDHNIINILVAIGINMLLLFIVLRHVSWIEKKLVSIGIITILNKIIGLILLAIAVRLFRLHLFA